MGFGTFDGIHPGHLAFLRQLQTLGEEVVVVIARDQNVEKLKGHAPRLAEKERFQAVLKTGIPDQVILGNLTHFYQCLLDHRPDVIGLGYDQKADAGAIQKILPHAKLVRLAAFEPHKYKSSLLKTHS